MNSPKSAGGKRRRTCVRCRKTIADKRRRDYCSDSCRAAAQTTEKLLAQLPQRWTPFPDAVQVKLATVLAEQGVAAALAATEAVEVTRAPVLTSDAPPVVLLNWIDNLYFSFDTQVTQTTFDALLEEKHKALVHKQERNAVYCSDWLNCKVYPNGADGYGVLLERGEQWNIKLNRDSKTHPGIFIEMRSKELHLHPGGPWGACEDAVAFIREVLLADATQEIRDVVTLGHEKLSRFDFHLDYQGGWSPTLETGERRLFVRPHKAKWNPHMEGATCTGYTIGKRRIQARIYNKSLEAELKHNTEYLELIKHVAGDKYNPKLPIWRVEFELRREGTQGFYLVSQSEEEDIDEEILAELEAEDFPTIGTVKRALRFSPDLWRYLTSRWLRLVVPGQGVNRSRWPVHPTWQVIQQGFAPIITPSLTDEQAMLVRDQRFSGKRRLLTKMENGLLTSAQMMLTDPGSALPAFYQSISQKAQDILEYQQLKASLGKQKLKDINQQQYAESVLHLTEMAIGVLAATGVTDQNLPRVDSIGDLLYLLAGDLDKEAEDKGGVMQLLIDKWCRLYKLNPPRRLAPPHEGERKEA